MTLEGKPIETEGLGTERLFTTQPLKGATDFEFKVTVNDNGKPKEHPIKVSLKPGDQKQVVQFGPPPPKGAARIKLLVPAGSEVTMDGKVVDGKGAELVFVTPVLNGTTHMTGKVKWTENGKQFDETLKIKVEPGDRQQIAVWN